MRDVGGLLVITRTELQLALLEAVRDLVRTGVTPVTAVDHGDRVEVGSDDGTRDTFDAVIGADGIHSWTRRGVLGGPEASYAGCAVVRFHMPNTDALTVIGGAAVAGPPRSLVRAMRDNPSHYYANINQVVGAQWVSNRVGLAGDAAHAMSPLLGQGAGVGLEDAALLAELLALPHMPVPLALRNYERIRAPLAQAVQKASHAVAGDLRSLERLVPA